MPTTISLADLLERSFFIKDKELGCNTKQLCEVAIQHNLTTLEDLKTHLRERPDVTSGNAHYLVVANHELDDFFKTIANKKLWADLD